MTLSPNFGERRDGARPELVVIHYTGMASCAESQARLCDPVAEVSAHWLIDTDGTTLQLVDEAMRAWHAGAGGWAGVTDVNSRSIGIELQNTGSQPFAEPQMAALERLLRGIMERWAIQPARVIGHSDMAPARKIDPGPRFDWRRLALSGTPLKRPAPPPARTRPPAARPARPPPPPPAPTPSPPPAQRPPPQATPAGLQQGETPMVNGHVHTGWGRGLLCNPCHA